MATSLDDTLEGLKSSLGSSMRNSLQSNGGGGGGLSLIHI